MAKTKDKDNIQDTEVKTKPKKTKKVETLEPKVSKVAEPLDDVKVDIEIDCRSYSNPSNSCVYIRRKRSI